MPRRAPQLAPAPGKATSAAQICRESIRVVLVRPSHFHSISALLFSPVPISLFLAHLISRRFPGLPASTLGLVRCLLERSGAPEALLGVATDSAFSAAVCLPSTLTFSLLGRAATARSVARSYTGGRDLGRVFLACGRAWARLLETCLWELAIAAALCCLAAAGLAGATRVLEAAGGGGCAWGAVGLLLGVPFSVGFAHLAVVGNLASVVAAVDGERGLRALARAKAMVDERRGAALWMAVGSSAGKRMVEGVFELRWSSSLSSAKGMRVWEWSVLVSMYSFLLVMETVQCVVFYYTSKGGSRRLLTGEGDGSVSIFTDDR